MCSLVLTVTFRSWRLSMSIGASTLLAQWVQLRDWQQDCSFRRRVRTPDHRKPPEQPSLICPTLQARSSVTLPSSRFTVPPGLFVFRPVAHHYFTFLSHLPLIIILDDLVAVPAPTEFATLIGSRRIYVQ